MNHTVVNIAKGHGRTDTGIASERWRSERTEQRWYRDPVGRLLLPGQAPGARGVNGVLGVVLLAVAIVLLCLDW
jgi:hypothetical protein